MRYGICSWVFGSVPLGRVASDVAALEYEGVELFGDWDRRGVGREHIPFADLLGAPKRISYKGPMVAECTAPDPDPFEPIKGPGSHH